MGKVSMALIITGLFPLVPAIILTLISIFYPTFIPETAWFNLVVRFFAIGILYVVAFAFIILPAERVMIVAIVIKAFEFMHAKLIYFNSGCSVLIAFCLKLAG